MTKKIFLGCATLFALIVCSLYIPLPRHKLKPAPEISLRIMDREGHLLREVLSDKGGRCHWVDWEDMSEDLLKATLAAEDRQFFIHRGISFPSIIRAVCQNLKSGHVVSGASTISQQLIRNLYTFRRNLLSKLLEAWLAVRLENTLSKKDILIQYLNRISYGNQAYGIEAASLLYFDKPAKSLSLAESAFLAGIPRAPSLLNPYIAFDQTVKRQRLILHQMLSMGLVDRPTVDRSLDEQLQLIPSSTSFKAPHFCDYILSQYSSSQRQQLSVIRTTCDYPLQSKVELLVKNHINSLRDRNISNAAVVVMDNVTGEILSLVGSNDFFASENDGQVNGALSLRQPGSALKPFTYGLALEKGMTAAEFILDTSVQYPTPEGPYRPKNYDKRFHGPVRLRTALACSYNVPAVRVLETIGPEALYYQLKDMGFDSLSQGPGYYGIGLTLGNGEVSLLELVQAYSSLARGGVWMEAASVLDTRDFENSLLPQKSRTTRRVYSPQVAYILTHILNDQDARIPSFGYNSSLSLPFPCAAKTGTSKDFRDNWTIGYSSNYTVGVWIGNFDGQRMHNVSGVSGCGPLFRDIMLTLERQNPGLDFEKTDGLIETYICPLSGNLAGDDCPGTIKEIFVEGTEPENTCSIVHSSQDTLPPTSLSGIGNPSIQEVSITFPRDGDVFKIDPVLRRGYQKISFKASLPAHFHIEKLEWWINGQKISETGIDSPYSWKLQPGLYTMTVLARSEGRELRSRPVRFRVVL